VLPEEPKAARDRGLCFLKINCDAKDAKIRREFISKVKLRGFLLRNSAFLATLRWR